MDFKPSLVLGCVVACLGVLTFACPASAQTAPPKPAPAAAAALPPSPTVTGPSKIAIISIQVAITNTAEGKKLEGELDARFAPKNTEIQNGQRQIEALQKQLTDGGNTMSQQAKADLNNEIQTKQRDYQQTAQNAQSDYQNAQTELMNQVGGKMMPILKTYAEQHGYTAVVDVSFGWPQSPVLYYNPGIDITGDIIKLYDQAHPVTVASNPGH